MAGLQRSTISFRRQGSSGIVWDDRFLSGELKQDSADASKEEGQQHDAASVQNHAKDEQNKEMGREAPTMVKPIRTGGGFERSRSNGGGRGHRTRVSPAIDPPSPRLSACGCCTAFGKKQGAKKSGARKRPPPPKRRSR